MNKVLCILLGTTILVGQAKAAVIVRDPLPSEALDLAPINEFVRGQAQIGDSQGPSTPGDANEGLLSGGFDSTGFDFQVIDGTAHPFKLTDNDAGSTTLTYGDVTSSPVQRLFEGNALKIQVFSAYSGVTETAALSYKNGNGDIVSLGTLSATGPNGSAIKIITGTDFDFSGSELSGTITTTGAQTSIFAPRGSTARVTATLFTTTVVPEPSTLGLIACAFGLLLRRAR